MKATRPPRLENARQTILAEATRLFARNGLEGTTLQAVADAVGIRKPSLIHHFASKEELYEAVLEALLAHWKDEIPRLLLAASDEHDRFSSAARALTGFFRSDPDRARLVFREVLDRPQAAQARFQAHIAPWIRLVTDYIRTDQGVGRVRPEVDPEAWLVLIILMVLGSTAAPGETGAMVGAGADFADRLTRELTRMAQEALFTHSPRNERQGA